MQPDAPHAAQQAAFHAALWQGDPPEGLAAPTQAERMMRFSVYRNTVRNGLIRALAERFPVTQALVGVPFFRAMARAFIAIAPPRDPVLLRWGAALPGFLDRFPPVAHLPWLGDVARLERARGRAFHAADAAPVSPDALRVPDPGALRLVLHPSVALIASRYPAPGIWQAHQPGGTCRMPGTGPEQALIGRQPDLAVIVVAVDAGTHAVLSALAAGAPLGRAAAHANPTAALTLLLRHGLIIGTTTGETA
ncbi:MAG: HvfC/BufC N-terminal domain-containing protein [Pararhodobacter sp.]